MNGSGAGARSPVALLREAIACIVAPGSVRGSGAPHVRGTGSVDSRQLQFVVASLPAVLVNMAGATGTAGSMAFWLQAAVTGLIQILPLLLLCLLVCLFWEVVFARMLERAADAGWLVTAWFLAVLLPPSIPPIAAVVAVSFGVVFGAHIFGGTGRYLISPALLGAVFALVAWPALFSDLPYARSDVPLALACLAGGMYLAVRGTVSWRTLAGGVLGVLLADAVIDVVMAADQQTLWYRHLIARSFAFGLAFIATDPTTMPLTRAARWLHGLTFGVLAVLIGAANPQAQDAAMFALLFSFLLVPLFDYLVVAVRIRALRGEARR